MAQSNAFMDSLRNMWNIPELRRRLLFTLGLLAIYRLGGHVPTPGVDATALAQLMKSNSMLGLYDLFVGGSFSRATIFALGIMPYISASIILQVLGTVVPHLEKLQKEGEEGRRKITQYTRYGTVLISLIQSYAFSMFLESFKGASGVEVVSNPGMSFRLITMLTQTTGTIGIMWLGEQITERGIGNGISLIIMVGIIARLPNDLITTFTSLKNGTLNALVLIPALLFMFAVIASVVLMTQAQRKIPVQYAKRVVGRKTYGGQNTHIPLRVNTAGVIPIIFAQSLIILPVSIAAFFPKSDFLAGVAQELSHNSPIYVILYSLVIIFFTYFYTAVVLNPEDLAENIRKFGGFVPGIRPGKKTAEYIDYIMNRITLPGAVFLAAIAVVPDLLVDRMNLTFRFGGTSVLIVVGVALDTLQQIESHLLMRHYDGLVKKGKLRGRR
ncbi:MAG: preprotein translocase subunit SecY [Candidatus Eisenbacteria bacterium]|nr:preprotein translocase subunit SecY [Candidatus Eisenbacteria bacterium]